MTTATVDLLKAAQETYQLEMLASNGLNPLALEKAILSALAAHEQSVIFRLASMAEQYASDMEESTDQENPDFTTALKWFAWKLREQLSPVTGPYEPREGDVVEVVLTGAVMLWEGRSDDFDWSMFDDETGDEMFFRTKSGRAPRLRVLSRNETEGK